MFCPKCGTNNPDGSQFCMSCGATLAGGRSSMEAGSSDGGDSSADRRPGRSRRSRRDPAGVRILREMGTSPMFLTAAIAYTASVALTIIGSAMAASSSLGWLSGLLDMADTDGSLYELERMLYQYQGILGSAGFVSALITSIPTIITAVALWLIYVNAKKEPGEEFSTAGFTILHVFATISFVAIVIGIVLYVIFGIVGVGSISRLSDGEGTGAGIVIFLIVGVFVVFPIIYSAKLRTMLGSSKKMAAGGPVEQTASIYVGVMVMLQVFGSLGGLVLSPGILKLQALAAGTASVCFSLLIFSFREKCLNPARASAAAHPEDGSLPEERPFFGDESVYGDYPVYEDIPASAADAGGYNPAEWTGYEPEAVHPASSGAGAAAGLGVPDPYDTIVEPAPRIDSGFFQGDPEGTIVESFPGAFSGGVFPGAGQTPGFLSGNDTMMAYPEESVQEPSVQGQGSLFSAAQDIGGKSGNNPDPFADRDRVGTDEDPFGNRAKPVFPVREQQFYGPENESNRPQGNLVFNASIAAEEADNRAAEQERLAQQKAEEERIAREKAEQERLAQEKAEQERLERERARAEQERLAQERAEQERIAREKAEQERLARERAEQERLAQERAEQERIAREKAEQERLARERAEQERLAQEKAEQERIAREKAEQERIAREKAEQERLARERAEQERLAQEKAEQERIAREKAEQERIAREREEQRRLAQERAEQERLARERAQQARQNFAPGSMPIYETTTLSTSPLKQPPATLIRHRDQSHVTIRSTLLRIGRNVSDVDYWVRGNPAIGRHHADILFREGDYYIIDRNSTNHVYVNGKMIAPNEEILLPNQAVIRLADEEFTFQVSRY